MQSVPLHPSLAPATVNHPFNQRRCTAIITPSKRMIIQGLDRLDHLDSSLAVGPQHKLTSHHCKAQFGPSTPTWKDSSVESTAKLGSLILVEMPKALLLKHTFRWLGNQNGKAPSSSCGSCLHILDLDSDVIDEPAYGLRTSGERL